MMSTPRGKTTVALAAVLALAGSIAAAGAAVA